MSDSERISMPTTEYIPFDELQQAKSRLNREDGSIVSLGVYPTKLIEQFISITADRKNSFFWSHLILPKKKTLLTRVKEFIRGFRRV